MMRVSGRDKPHLRIIQGKLQGSPGARPGGRIGQMCDLFDFFDISDFWFLQIWRIFTDGNGPGRVWKTFVEAVRFILGKYGPVSGHGDPV